MLEGSSKLKTAEEGGMGDGRPDGGASDPYKAGVIFFFKQKTAYEVRNCDWSSDVCSSDLNRE